MTALTRASGLKNGDPALRKKKPEAAAITDPHAHSIKLQQDQAIEAAFGLLKGKDVLPLDALQFERDMRDE